MPSAGEIKNATRNIKQGAKAAKEMATDVTKGLSIGKALFEGVGSKIGNGTAFLMVLVALLLDVLALLALIPLVGWILGPLIYVLGLGIFGLWFKLAGAKFFSSRATASKIVTAILEVIPEISAFIPGATINVVVAVAFVRIEEFATKEAAKGEPASKPEGVKTQTASGPEAGVKSPRREPLPRAGQTPERSNVVRFRPRNTQDVVAPSIKQPGESNPPQGDEIAA